MEERKPAKLQKGKETRPWKGQARRVDRNYKEEKKRQERSDDGVSSADHGQAIPKRAKQQGSPLESAKDDTRVRPRDTPEGKEPRSGKE